MKNLTLIVLLTPLNVKMHWFINILSLQLCETEKMTLGHRLFFQQGFDGSVVEQAISYPQVQKATCSHLNKSRQQTFNNDGRSKYILLNCQGSI